MKIRLAISLSCSFLFFVFSIIAAYGMEKINRGFIALEREDGSVFLSWRLLDKDTEDLIFRVYRVDIDEDILLTGEKPFRLTNYVDNTLQRGSERNNYSYKLYEYDAVTGLSSLKKAGETTIVLTGKSKSYFSIPLKGDYDLQKVGVGDLDGDGAYEFVIKQPNTNIDPLQQPGYWKPSSTTYKLEAYRLDGTMMWRYDMGWAIEAGIWYSPWIIYDADNDGKAEVYSKAGVGDPRNDKGLVQTGREYLVKIDGETGQIVAETEWIERTGFSGYNNFSRNYLTIAHLDGSNPSIILQRGTYDLIRTKALDKDFNKIWYWESSQEKSKFSGQGSHGLITADVNRDGRDELIIGAAVLDSNGYGLWSLEMGHPDACHVADIDPTNPGLEIFYGFETAQKTDGLCLVDAATGKKLWGHNESTRHIHAQGMVGDILAEFHGMEVYAGELSVLKRWLYSSQGKLIENPTIKPLNISLVWWDADPQKEVIMSGEIRDWNGQSIQKVDGDIIAIVDCLGDYREEVITSLKGELRIYSTMIPAQDRHVHLMQDHQYRLGVVAQTMGYYYPAQTGPQYPK